MRKYDPEQVARIPTIRQQRAEIDALLDQEAPITTVFQPLVELTTGRLVGYEALSRFNYEILASPRRLVQPGARVRPRSAARSRGDRGRSRLPRSP